MKRYTFTVSVILFAILVLGGLFGISTSHAIGSTSITSSSGSARISKRHKNNPIRPFSGIVQGTVVATSTTSITIDKKTYRGKNATSTEVTFIMESQVRINADQAEYVTSSMADISIGSSVSLVIERVGRDAGKVREIQLQSGL
jgi:hypothetical protein